MWQSIACAAVHNPGTTTAEIRKHVWDGATDTNKRQSWWEIFSALGLEKLLKIFNSILIEENTVLDYKCVLKPNRFEFK